MSVSIVDDYMRQLRILDALRSQSEATRGQFDSARERYHQQIRQSQQLGYMGDYVEQLDERYREFSGHMDQTLQTLLRGEMRITDQEQRLRHLIADAMSRD